MQTITIAPPKRSWFSLLSWAVVIAVLVVSWQGAEMAPLTLIKDGGNMATFAADFFPPDFSQWQDYLTEMAVTLQIAVWGTALAVVLSIPFGLMSAENLGAKHANHHHRSTQAQLVLASELGRCYRRAGRLVAGRGNGTAYAD